MLRHAAALVCLSAAASSFPLSTTTTSSTGVDVGADAALIFGQDTDDADIFWEDLHFSLPPTSWTDHAVERAYNLLEARKSIGVDLLMFAAECDLYALDDGFWSVPWTWESMLWRGPAGPLQCSISLTPSLSPTTYPLQAEPLIRCHNDRQRFRCTL